MRTEDFGAELQRLGFSDFAGVPCSYLAPLINWAINENAFIMANNEGEAVAIASGISLACALPLSDKSGSASAHSLQRTASASHSFASHNPDFSSQMLPHESAIVKNSSDLSLRESRSDSWQSTKNNRKYGVVLMQNSGLSNALSPLTSLNHTFSIPILGFVSLRGEPNEQGQNTDEPQHELLGRITDNLLQTCEVECAFLDSRLEVAKQQLAHAKEILESNKSFFFIVRNNCFEKVALINNPLDLNFKNAESNTHTTSNTNAQRGSILRWICGLCSCERGNRTNSSLTKQTTNLPQIHAKDNAPPHNKPTRLQALQIIQNLGQNCAILATTGKCGRELYELGDTPNQLYMVGSMGCVSALGLGIALKSHKKVIAIDGDSALLMRLGTLAGNAYYARCANKGNFCHILLDNQSHDSTGGQFNISPFVDFVAVAKSCGYEVAKKAQNLDEFNAILAEFLDAQNGGAYFIYLDIAKGSKKDLGRPKITPKQVAQRFSAWLNES
ncbi:thiamine pyrophosphate-dependent enzyme [Helicobacter sp. 23-1046]